MNALVLPETFQHLLSREMQFFAGAAESAAVGKIFNGSVRVITFDYKDCGCWLQMASLKNVSTDNCCELLYTLTGIDVKIHGISLKIYFVANMFKSFN